MATGCKTVAIKVSGASNSTCSPATWHKAGISCQDAASPTPAFNNKGKQATADCLYPQQSGEDQKQAQQLTHTHMRSARARNPETAKSDALQVQSMCHGFKCWTWTPPLSKHMPGNGPWPCSCSWRETVHEKHGSLHLSFWCFFPPPTLLHLFKKRQKGQLRS